MHPSQTPERLGKQQFSCLRAGCGPFWGRGLSNNDLEGATLPLPVQARYVPPPPSQISPCGGRARAGSSAQEGIALRESGCPPHLDMTSVHRSVHSGLSGGRPPSGAPSCLVFGVPSTATAHILVSRCLSCSNIAEALVSKGLATVIRYRQDDDQRSSHYDELLAAEAR